MVESSNSPLNQEILFLKGLLKGDKDLRLLRRSWSWSTLLIILVVYFSVDLLLNFIAFFPLAFFFEDHFDTYIEISDDPAFLLIVGGLIAPFIEEILFRSIMVYEKRYWPYCIFFIAIILFFVHWVIAIIVLFGAIRIIAFKKNDTDIKRFYKKYGKHIFWVLTILFALVHITNYDFQNIPVYAYPFMVIPQFIGGVFLGIIRIRYGLRYAIIHHTFFNLFVISLDLLFPELFG